MEQDLIASLVSIIPPDRLSSNPSDLETHSHDESTQAAHPPEVVIWPEDTGEVSRVLRWANERRIPVTPWGGGSSLEGNPIPLRGGIALDMTRMDKVLELQPDDFLARVQPGIVGDDLNKRLSRHGLFFPAFPSSADVATIGGMIANNAGGMYTIRYGAVSHNVLALEVVLANGQVLRVGSRSIKMVAGYDLLHLLVGSEGTLGVITEATLRLRGLPQSRLAMLVSFVDIEHAVRAALDILGSGLNPAALELMDSAYVRLVNQIKLAGWREAPSLLIELHGHHDSINNDAAEIEALCRANGLLSRTVASTFSEQQQLWEGRRGVRPAIRNLYPDIGIMSGDVGVPLSKIPDLVQQVRLIGERHGVPIVTLGHAGDGNIHTWAQYSRTDEESQRRAAQANDEIIGYALQVGGTSSAEHGIGSGKRQFLQQEQASSLAQMAAIKRLFDPEGILNPGKIFLDE